MSTVFIGGSRQISRLPAPTLKRLNNVMSNDFRECSSVVMAPVNTGAVGFFDRPRATG